MKIQYVFKSVVFNNSYPFFVFRLEPKESRQSHHSATQLNLDYVQIIFFSLSLHSISLSICYFVDETCVIHYLSNEFGIFIKEPSQLNRENNHR